MRIQNVEELDLSKVTIVAKVDLRNKVVEMALEGVRSTEKMVSFDKEAKKILHRQRAYKEVIGRVGESFDFDNIILAYDKAHLGTILVDIQEKMDLKLENELQALQDKKDKFKTKAWGTN